LGVKRSYEVPTSVFNLAQVTVRVEERRKVLDAIESSNAVLVEFEVAGNWFGSPWRRQRRFRWMVYAALWDSHGEWADHAEELVRRDRCRSTWRVAQPSADALSAAEAFVTAHLSGAR
jgi:hypothetical protein